MCVCVHDVTVLVSYLLTFSLCMSLQIKLGQSLRLSLSNSSLCKHVLLMSASNVYTQSKYKTTT